MVKVEPDVKKLEEQLQGSQIEEEILQAEHELSLVRKMVEWKPWGVFSGKASGQPMEMTNINIIK